MQLKICRRCQQEKPITDFGRLTITKDGASSYCRKCHTYICDLNYHDKRLYRAELASIRASRIKERFWKYVDKNAPNGCWVWKSSTTDKGYGNFSFGTVHIGAHRFAYEQLIGPIPQGLTLDHLCRNKPCVNPAHLEPVSNRTNVLRGIGPTAINAHKKFGNYPLTTGKIGV